MIYPLISEYVEAIQSPEDNFDKLIHLRPVLDDSGNPFMSSGNFAVVFKMTDGTKNYAVKCFTRDQEGREEAYRQIAEELENVSSPFLRPIRYLEKELFVDSKNSAEEEFPVLQMDWVEGVTLDNFVRNNLHDPYALECLACNFCRMAQWLLTQPFAHGDLKPDNILVQSDGSLVLVDYDGMFVPAMKGEKARELGSPNFRHPLRTGEQFDEHIDDFALASIALSLKAIALKPELYNAFGATDRLLFSDADFRNLAESKALSELQTLLFDADFQRLFGLFLIACSEQTLANVSFRLFRNSKPPKPAPVEMLSTKATDEELAEAWEDEYGVKYSKDGKKLLEGNKSLSDYSIKPGTKVICDSAFDECKSLQSIQIPDSVTSIGKWAFSECSSLQSIHIPNSVSSIGIGTFERCILQIDIESTKFYSDGYCLIDLSTHRILCCHRNDLKNYSIPDSVTSIGDEAFSCCSSLQSINIPNSVTSIGEKVLFNCKSLQSINIPNSVTSIGNEAFSCCETLRSIHIPNSVTSIGDGAFSECASLQSINIPDSVTSIDSCAFHSCSSLQSIHIPDSVTSIKDWAFCECSFLQSISIPNSVTNIGFSAFFGCKSLQSINIPNSVTSIGKNAFSLCKSLQTIHIPRGTREKFEGLLPDDTIILEEID